MNLIKLLLEFNKIGREIANKSLNEDLAQFLYVKLKKLADFDTFSFGKLEKDLISYLFYVEDDKIVEALEQKIEPGKSLVYHSVSHNEVIIINDYDLELYNYVKGYTRVGNTSVKYGSILVYPFEINGKTSGFFSIQNKEKGFFTPERIILFKEVAQYISMLFERMENSKTVDKKRENFKISQENSLNPFRSFTSSLISKVKNIDDLVLLFCEKLHDLYSFSEIELKIHKGYSLENTKYLYREKSIKKIHRIRKDNKQALNLNINETYLGEVYLNKDVLHEIDENFEILTDLFCLSLNSFIEKEELEFENAQKYHLMQALESSYKNIHTINEIVKDITSTLDIKELGWRVYDGLKKLFNSDCAIALTSYNKKLETLEYDILIDYGQEYSLGSLHKSDNTAIAPWVIRNRKAVIINDYDKEVLAFLHNPEDQVGNSHVYSLLYLPLFRDSEIVGVFSVQKKEKNFFDNYNIELVKSIASFVNISMINLLEARQLSTEIQEKMRYEKKLEKTNKKLEKISSLDSLTKLYNRRYFEKILKEFWTRATKEQKKLGFIIFDMDYFKQINDSFGHLAGDRALTEMSGIIKKIVKKDIKFGRFGGDEFVGVLFNPEKDFIINLGKELKTAIEEKKIPCPDSPTKFLTLTMGITLFYPSELHNVNNLFLKADEALYKGKELGRNHIVFYENGEFKCLD